MKIIISEWLKLVMAGWMLRASFESLVQDFYGMEKYLALLRDTWISPWVTVPLAVACIVWAGYLIFTHEGD